MEKINELLKAVSVKTGLSKEEVLLKIKNKQRELSGLVSEEGAAYIVANELGVKTKNKVIESTMAVKDISAGMKSVNIAGRVKSIFGPREFTSKKGYKGKVANLNVFDKSGSTRVVLWNMSDIERVEKGELKVGDIIQVKNGYVREGYQGGFEVNLGNRGILIVNPQEVKTEDIPESDGSGGFVKTPSERLKITDLKDGDTYKEIRGVLVDIYGDKFVYNMCPNCNKSIEDSSCAKCGQVTPNKLLILNSTLDDGSSTIRSTFFREAAEKLLGFKTEEATDRDKMQSRIEEIKGKEIILSGKVKKNEVMERLEFNVYEVRDIEPVQEATSLLEKAM